MTGFWGCTKPC
uniref:Uncharacterized protein n=1 Tax=Anguilla anguilla TaxID=7936 RepID=A0A0E9UU35_ANGAN